jgi:glutaredoxin
LTDHDVPHTVINIDHDEEAAFRVEQWNNGNRMVPTVDIDGTIMTNPSPTQLRQALGL